MKRIIFSLYTDKVDSHTSANDYKKSQFEKYKQQLQLKQKDYAIQCKADYELFTTVQTNYNDIQFEKISKIEKLCKNYDEVLYFDFDVIPRTHDSFFEKFNLDNLCLYSVPTEYPTEVFHWRKDNPDWIWNPMDMFIKTCAKNAMLLLDSIVGTYSCVNTGVFGANKKSVEALAFTDRLSLCKRVLEEAMEDNIYPKDISSTWIPNNEVFVSYLIERFNIPFTDVGLPWNFILDHSTKSLSAGSHLVHCVNKEFSILL